MREGSAELLPESHLSDGETLLNYALRREFVGGVVTNDRMQLRAALERAEGEPAASAARLAFAHHLVPYAFEGAEMRFSTRAHAESSESSESPESRASDFEERDAEISRRFAPRRARTRREGETRGETSSPRGRRAPLRAWTRRTPRRRRRRSASRTRRTGSTRCARRRRRRRRRERDGGEGGCGRSRRESAARAITPRRTRTRRCTRRTVRRTRGRVADRDRQAGQDAARRASENEAILIRLEEYSTRRDVARAAANASTRRIARRIADIWNSRMARASVIDTNERTNKRTGRRFETNEREAEFATTRPQSVSSSHAARSILRTRSPFAAASIGSNVADHPPRSRSSPFASHTRATTPRSPSARLVVDASTALNRSSSHAERNAFTADTLFGFPGLGRHAR